MDKIFNWIEKHKKISIFVLLAFVFLPILLSHLMFKKEAPYAFFEHTFEAGDLLGYFGAVLSFVATVVLGYITLKLNDKAIAQNDKILDLQYNQSKSIVIVDTDKDIQFYTKNEDPILPQRLDKKGIDVNFDYVDDVFNTNDIMIMEIWLKNISSNYVTGIEIDCFEFIEYDDDGKVEWSKSPLKPCEDDIGAFIKEDDSQKIRFVLTGLKDSLTVEQWTAMKTDFFIKLKLKCNNIYNQKTTICLETSAFLKSNNEKSGKITYETVNYEYKQL